VEFAREKGCLLTLGIKPTHPSTGFGYIRRAPRPARPERPRVFKVMKFVEKPELKVAEAFLKSGEYLWNSGIFIWRIDALFRALKALNPPLYSLAAKGCPHHYRRLKDESIDYAIMEKARGIYCVEANLEWHDLGSWASLAQMREGDSKGNVSLGLCETYDADNSISVSEPGHLVSLCGVSGLVVVQTKDATLVCSKKKAEEVKELVNKLEKKRGLKRYL
jgi:mannose-1-phosphate guanylyltransferase